MVKKYKTTQKKQRKKGKESFFSLFFDYYFRKKWGREDSKVLNFLQSLNVLYILYCIITSIFHKNLYIYFMGDYTIC